MQEVPSDLTRLLVIGAHPDDAEFFAGGTLAEFVTGGAAVHLAVCTDGGRGGRDVPDVVAVRKNEQSRAAAVLGLASTTGFAFADGELEANEELRRAIVREIRARRPEVVLGHDPRTLWTSVGDRVELGHSDHRAAGRALLDAVYPRAASPNFYPDLKSDLDLELEPWCPREVWLFDTDHPDLVLDVTQTWPKKLEALRAHVSQEGAAGGLSAAALELARKFGEGERVGEGFVRLKIW